MVPDRIGPPSTSRTRVRGAPPFSGSRLYYGWVQLLVLSITELVSWGIVYYAFSVLIVPMGNDLGWTRVEMTGAFSCGTLISGLAGVPVGRWVDRHGARAVMTIGSIAASLLMVAWANVTSLPVFYLIWIGLGVTMAAVLYEPSFVVVTTWFRRDRARALAILTFFGGLASVVFLPLTSWLVERWGWREALLILAAILAILTIAPHGIFLRHRPADLGLEPDGQQVELSADGGATVPPGNGEPVGSTLHDAVRGSAFWWMSLSFSLIWGCSIATLIHLIPYLQDRGFSATFAATAAGAIGLLKLPGRLIFAPLSTRISQQAMALAVFLPHAAAIAMLAIADSRAMVLVFVVLFSVGNGTLTLMRATLVADVFGLRAYGGISGVVAMMNQAAMALGPIAVSLLVAIWGTYTPVFWLLSALVVASAAGILRVRDAPAADRTVAVA